MKEQTVKSLIQQLEHKKTTIDDVVSFYFKRKRLYNHKLNAIF